MKLAFSWRSLPQRFGVRLGPAMLLTSVPPIIQRGNDLQWITAEPVLAADGTVKAVLIGDLNPTALSALLDPQLTGGTNLLLVDQQRRLIYDTVEMRSARDDSGLLAAGVLRTTVNNQA